MIIQQLECQLITLRKSHWLRPSKGRFRFLIFMTKIFDISMLCMVCWMENRLTPFVYSKTHCSVSYKLVALFYLQSCLIQWNEFDYQRNVCDWFSDNLKGPVNYLRAFLRYHTPQGKTCNTFNCHLNWTIRRIVCVCIRGEKHLYVLLRRRCFLDRIIYPERSQVHVARWSYRIPMHLIGLEWSGVFSLLSIC